MIVPMKKVAILVQSKDSAQAVEALSAQGLLHVEHQQPPGGKEVDVSKEEVTLVEETIAVLSQERFCEELSPSDSKELADWKFAARHILDLRNRLNQLVDYALTVNNSISQWEEWGDFDPETVSALRDRGVHVRLYQIPIKEIKKVPSGLVVEKISAVAGFFNCAVISLDEINLPFKEVPLPKIGLKGMYARLSENNRVMESIKTDIRKAACYKKAFVRIKQSLEEELEFHRVLSGMGESEGFTYLRGYIPYDRASALRETAAKQGWGIAISEPSENDKVPTLIRNPRWVSIITPVFKLIEVIPGYNELDISVWFLIFFSVFFGMLIGDAGIGLIFLGLVAFAQKKWGRRFNDKNIFILLYISSACCIIWGVLSGTFFGQEWLPQSVRPLLPALRDRQTVQNLCFFLGALHLSIAHGWRALIKAPSFSALAEMGWILILWGAFFLARILVLGREFPVGGKWCFVGGMVLVIFFTSPQGSLFKRLGAGSGHLLLNLVNSFTDVVSYVRLFAVGLATVAVADAFNRMAMGVGLNGVFAVLTTALILLSGHTLNILLAPMSILVHGVRLNVLEFCNHVDVKWSGFAYEPLRKKTHDKKA